MCTRLSFVPCYGGVLAIVFLVCVVCSYHNQPAFFDSVTVCKGRNVQMTVCVPYSGGVLSSSWLCYSTCEGCICAVSLNYSSHKQLACQMKTPAIQIWSAVLSYQLHTQMITIPAIH